MNRKLIIETPRGVIVQTSGGKAVLKWHDVGPKYTRKLMNAQEYVDNEVLRRSSKYVPLRSGALMKSGTLGTKIGSGKVSWITRYAAKQYYATSRSRAYDPLRGGMWFERMKSAEGKTIIKGAKKLVGGK